MVAFWAVFTFGGGGPAITAHGSLDLKQEIQIQIGCSSFSSFYPPKLNSEYYWQDTLCMLVSVCVHIVRA
jgi:hypothetical protein